MRRVIRLGDRTSHGGYVVSATSHFTVMGMDVARLGDKCTCPKKGHNNCYIVEGDPDWTIDGVPVALEGHKLSCGAVLISSMPNAGREDWGGAAAAFSQMIVGSDKSVSSVVAADLFNEKFQLLDEDTGKPLANVEYAILRESGDIEDGRTDEDGHTHLLSATADSEFVDIFV
jgi:uncharacterized Zn-binding protein involved in type VI secretion